MRHFINKLFIEHPDAVGESYLEHLVTATGFAVRMVFGGIACFLHGVFPFLCIKTGSGIITGLHRSMVTHRSKNAISDCHDREVDALS